MKKISLLFIFCLFICGCTENHDREDVKNYVKKQLNLTDIEISKKYKEKKDKEGYTDKIWTVVDKKNNITFHVIDDYGYSGESVSNSLTNNYDVSVFKNYYPKMKKQDNIEVDENDTGYSNLVLNCKYKNKKEIDECYNSLKYYGDYLKNKGFTIYINYQVTYDKEMVGIKNYDADTVGNYKGTMSKKQYNKILLRYYSYGVAYQITDILDEMNDSDMNDVYNYEENYRIYTIKNDEKKYYENVITSTSSGISYGSLYRVLKEEGFKLSGDVNHYTVFSNDGTKYEISYDFKETDNDEIKYYYYKNGTKTEMDSYHTDDFGFWQVKDMFKLDLYEENKSVLTNEQQKQVYDGAIKYVKEKYSDKIRKGKKFTVCTNYLIDNGYINIDINKEYFKNHGITLIVEENDDFSYVYTEKCKKN